MTSPTGHEPGSSADGPPPPTRPGAYPPPTQPGYGPPPGPPGGQAYQPYAQGPPAKKKRSKALIGLLGCGGLFLLAIIVIAVAVAVAPKPTGNVATSTASSAGANPGATPAPASPGSSKDSPAPIGTEVTPAKGWTIKVTAGNVNADIDMLKVNQFNTPEAGKQWVSVDLTATNGTGRPEALGSGVKLSLLTPGGVAVQESFYPVPGRLDSYAQLQPGTVVSGKLSFQVPKADAALVVLLAEPLLTLDQNEDQRFLAIQ